MSVAKTVVGPMVNEAYLESLRDPEAEQESTRASSGNDMARALGDAAGGSTFTHNGKVYRLSAPNVGRAAQFCEWVKRNAREELAEFATLIPRDVYAASVTEFAKTARGTFVWGKPKIEEELNTPSGMVEWVRILLFEHHPTLTTDDVIQMVQESGEKIKLALAVFFPKETGEATQT